MLTRRRDTDAVDGVDESWAREQRVQLISGPKGEEREVRSQIIPAPERSRLMRAWNRVLVGVLRHWWIVR